MPKRLILLLSVAIFGLSVLFSQDVLAPTKTPPVQNGEIAKGEYPFSKIVAGITISGGLSMDGKFLFIAASAKTSGWVAFGLGAPFMDSSKIFMGYDANGTANIVEQKGFGHGHSAISTENVVAWAVKESEGVTTMELKLVSAPYLKGSTLPVIAAFGMKDDFTSRHNARGMLSLTLQ